LELLSYESSLRCASEALHALALLMRSESTGWTVIPSRSVALPVTALVDEDYSEGALVNSLLRYSVAVKGTINTLAQTWGTKARKRPWHSHRFHVAGFSNSFVFLCISFVYSW
jgi:hypothetical protein